MKQSNGKTVWQHEEKKWKPRTYQAAKVFFPAHDIHRPPEPIKEPVFAEPFEVKLARERKEWNIKLAVLVAKYGLLPKPGKRARVKPRHKPKKNIKNFAAKQMKKLAQMAEKAATR